MSDYIVSARKYRPDSFETLIGQDNIARTLKNSILRGQLAHAYLFCGPRGVGKTSTARIFAKTINCSNPGPDMEPCGECESCLSFQEGRSYCIHELDAASNNSVDDIRSLMEKVQIPPQVGKYSVYIIDEVHMLTASAFNAFLKTLEEPPAHAIFILATTEKHKILPTILSRCQTYDFNRISIVDIVRNLRGIADREGVKADDKSLHVIAQKADGAMRDALTLFDQTVAFCGTDIRYEDVIRNLNVLDYEYCFKLVDAFLSSDYAVPLKIFDGVLADGFNALHFISSLGSHLRDLLVARTGGLECLLDLPDSLKEAYREQAGRCSVKFIYDALGIVAQAEAGYRASVNQRLHIEFALMRMAFLQGVPGAQSAATVPQPAATVQQPSPTASPVQPIKAPSSNPAAEPASRPVPTPSPAVEAVPATSVPSVQAAEAPVAQVPKPVRKTVKTGASLSLDSLMKEESDTAKKEEVKVSDGLPTDGQINEAWKELPSKYPSQPRLANLLETAKLAISEQEGYKIVSLTLVSEAQKAWMMEKHHRSMEDFVRKRTASSKVKIVFDVLPQEEQEQKIYMPVEKAQDLMNKNNEVRALVSDLALDVK